MARAPHLALLAAILLAMAGCSGPAPKSNAADGVPDPSNPNDPDNPLPDAPVYAGGFVSPTGGYIEGDSVSFYCDLPANSTVKVDLNRSLSGGAHSHDMWGGEQSKVIFDAEVRRFVSGNWFETPGAIVFPGAGRAEFRLDWDAVGPLDYRQLGVDLPILKRSSGDVHVDYLLNFTSPGQVHSLNFSFENNDRPHAERTSWRFKMQPYNGASDAVPEQARTVGNIVQGTVASAAGLQAAHMTWTLYRTYDCLPVDPPHYDMWENKSEKLIVQTTTTHAWRQTPGVSSGYLYGFPQAINNTVPPGTGTVIVDIRWTADEPWPAKLGLEYIGADSKKEATTTVWKVPPPATDEGNYRRYVLTVHPLEADSPYANKTAWDFRLYFDAFVHDAVDDVGQFTGTVDWVITAYREGSVV